MKATFEKVLEKIRLERKRQDAKFGMFPNHPNEWWLPKLVEELGEVAEAMLDDKFGMSPDKPTSVHKELVQLTALGFSWLEEIERRYEYH